MSEIKPNASPRYRYLVVGILAAVYTFNFMDRQILGTLAEPIRKEFGLSDTQLGALTGASFALFYATLGIPVAWMADRFNRVWIMAASCAVWSFFTAGCGMAANFVQLALCRIMVGVGEAGGVPPAYSVISDYFPAKARGTGLSVFGLGVPLGSTLGVAFGGGVASVYGWRTAFFAVGLPGILLALILLLVVREPKRGGLDPLAQGEISHAPAPPALEVFKGFWTSSTLRWAAVAAGLSAFVCYALLGWNAAYLMRGKGASLAEVSLYYSLVVGGTGITATLASGLLVDKLGQRDRRWYSWIPAIAYALMLPPLAGMIWAPDWQIALLFMAGPMFLYNFFIAPTHALVQNAVPPAQRTVAGAILLFVLNLVGLGGGPVYVGHVSDMAKARFGDHSLMIGFAALGPVIILAVGAHLMAARSIAHVDRVACSKKEKPRKA